MKLVIGAIFLVFVIVIGMTVIDRSEAVFNNNHQFVSEQNSTTLSETENTISIYISGEVKKAGTYEVIIGSFLYEVIQMAGGTLASADESCFDYYLSLETDMDIYIPYKTDDIKISINDASLESLTTLNGIGSVIGNRIIEYRDIIGAYSYLEQLMEVDGLGKSIFNKIKDSICL